MNKLLRGQSASVELEKGTLAYENAMNDIDYKWETIVRKRFTSRNMSI